MPIYAYRCESCGFARDVLQKVSDAPLTECPSCGEGQFRKQLTAAGFQLKGSGWYVTDFKGNGSAKAADKPAAEPAAKPQAGGAPAGETTATPTTTPPAAAPAGGCGAGCACH